MELPEIPNIPESERTPVVEGLLAVVHILLEQVTALEAENARLQERIARLQERIARLEKNSSNSSKPPSSDITKPKEEQRQPGKRKIGAQPGHKGSWRRDFLPEEITNRVALKLSRCPECHAALEATDEVEVHHQAELVERPVEVTEYQLHGGHCPCCQKTLFPPLPEGVIPEKLLGPRVVTLFGYMKAAMGVSISELAEFSKDVLKLDICRGAVQNAILSVSEAIKPAYEELASALPQQPALHIDETGWKENGKRHWVWLFCNSFIAYFVISKSRGCQILTAVLGENFLGALTSDFYSAYVKYASPKQQFCLAHFIREVKFLIALPSPEAKQFGTRLLAYMRRLFKLWHARKTYSPEQWKKKCGRFKGDFLRYLCSQRFERGSHPHRIKRRCMKHWDALFRFLDAPELYEPTNNLAERTLRHLVRLRRASYGSRGTNGSLWNARAASVIATCKLQQRSAWNFFLTAVKVSNFGGLQPSLLTLS